MRALEPEKFTDFGLEADKIAKRINATLADVFGHDSFEYKEYDISWASFVRLNMNYEYPQNKKIKNFRHGIESAAGNLQTAIDIMNERLTDIADHTPSPTVTAHPSASDIFVVHGHDEAALQEVARFIGKAGLKPIILHEQASGGRTVIEKLEHYSDVGFAVVLLTPDDEGGPRGGATLPRARQNVIAELFYFLGKLGRSRVCALKKSELEIPSDIGGIVYVPLDAHGGWKAALLRELKGAEYEVDLSALL